jgi:hypothetical protein
MRQVIADDDDEAAGLAICPELYSSRRIFRYCYPAGRRGTCMKKTSAIVALVLSLISSGAMADERRGSDAALGALSGAVVFGPVGAVAGAVVGYTAGPSIAHSWGFRRSTAARRGQRSTKQEAQVSPVDSQPVPNRPAAAPPAAQAPPPSPKAAASTTAPPVQGLE